MDVLIKHFGTEKPVVGIDIGTYCGDSARAMLWALPQAHVYTIDPWIHNPGHEFEAGEPQPFHNGNKELALRKFAAPDIEGRVTVLEMTSSEAFHHITENLGIKQVDFVWIDGNHEPDAVRSDIDTFFPLVKPEGIFGGHDFGQIWPLTSIIFEKFGGKIWSGPDFAWWVYREQIV
jgi:predicted O-methyltransferase YrrM